MPTDADSLVAFILLSATVALLAFGLYQARMSIRTGGIKSGLARVITNPVHGRRFILYLVAILASFLCSGAAGAISILMPPFLAVLNALSVTLFVIGAVAIFLMLTNGIERRELSFSEKLHLQEEEPGLLAGVEPSGPAARDASSNSMYVVSEVPIPGSDHRLSYSPPR